MPLTWFDPQNVAPGLTMGSLALWAPLLQRLRVADIIEQHLPTDPQAEHANGDVLSLLVAARLSNPMALVHVGDWARQSGAELLWGIPADKLNDDRLGRALDKFYPQRHSILASIALHAAREFDLPLERLHYDPTHLFFYGDYASSQPRATSAEDDPPAHITTGHSLRDHKIVHVGVCAATDDYGTVPIFGHVTDGNHNGHTAVAEQFELLQQHLRPQRLMLFSDRGTFSAGPLARLHQQGFHALCSAPWKDFRALYDQHRPQLRFRQASYLSLEQKRRRATGSTLPHQHYELAVLKHVLTDPQTQQTIRARVLFVLSTAEQKVARKARDQAITQIRGGLEKLTQAMRRGHHRLNAATITRRIAKLLGNKGAARYFHWELVPLCAEEQAALPPPGRGCRRPSQRLVFSFDATAAEADAVYDGMTVLVTTAPLSDSADVLFSQFKEQNLLEHAHHQWKTPLAVRPVFLKNPRRVEALVYLLLIALSAYHLLQRRYRQNVPAEATDPEKRTTTETLVRAFAGYVLSVRWTRRGRVISASQLSPWQQTILHRLRLATPRQMLSEKLPRHPT